ncbi:MAG: efflux RND transporter periplasmic adaptor subunit [Rikenellaceae bacterium]
MKNINILYATAVMLLFASCSSTSTTTSTAQISIPVTVEEISLGDLEQLTTTNGSLIAMSSAIITNKIEGTYRPAINPTTGKYYKIGDKVKAGAILARLEDQEFVNDLSVETKKINWEIAQGEYDKYVILQEKGGATEIEVKNAAVNVETTKNAYANAQISYSSLIIKSPISGEIVDLEYQTPGVEISAGISLFTVMDYSKMYLNISLSESTMSYINTGLPVYISHYSVPDEYLNATIDQLSSSIDSQTRTYKGVVTVDNPDLLLKPGMFVKTEIVVDTALDAIIIPKEIIRTSQNRKFVFIADGTTAIQCEIETGIEDDTYIEIVSGLSLGDKLIVDGYQTLRNRSKIAIQ